MKRTNKRKQKNWVANIITLGILAILLVGCVGCAAVGDKREGEITPTNPIQTEPANETIMSQETENNKTEPTEELYSTPTETTPPDIEDTEPQETEPMIAYETMYATSNVNVRSGPGTNYKILGVLGAGEPIQRISAEASGWSKVIYNGEEAYISSGCLSSQKPAKTDATIPTTGPSGGHTHQYDGGKTVAPTCTEKGFTQYTCLCGYSYKDNEVAALGHSYTGMVVAPTTKENGYTLHTCSACGDSYTDSYVDKLPSEPSNPTEAPSEPAGTDTPNEPSTVPTEAPDEPSHEQRYHCAICGGDHLVTLCPQEPPEMPPHCGWCGEYGHSNDECTIGPTNTCSRCGREQGAENGHYMWVNDTECYICGELVPGMTCHFH